MENFLEFIHSDLGLVVIAGLFTLFGTGITIFFTRIFQAKDQKKLNAQQELEKCRKEIGELRKKLDVYEAVVRSETGDYLVQKESGAAICPICWPDRHKPIPIYEDSDTGKFTCSSCRHTGIFNRIKVLRIDAEKKSYRKFNFACYRFM